MIWRYSLDYCWWSYLQKKQLVCWNWPVSTLPNLPNWIDEMWIINDNYVIMVVQADTVSYVTSSHHIIWETTEHYLHQLFGLWWTGRIHSSHMYHFSNSARLKNAVHRVMQNPGTAEGFKHLELGKDHFPRSWNSNPLDMSHKSWSPPRSSKMIM